MFGKSRLEAFSDGVLAIILTIMVLELKTPTEADIASLLELGPKFFSYILSFIYIGIYWNNHHHMFSTVEKVNGKILWANFNLLFWLSLIPFSTSWMGETKFSEIGTFTYGVVLFMAAVAYFTRKYYNKITGGKFKAEKSSRERMEREVFRSFLFYWNYFQHIQSLCFSWVLYISGGYVDYS